MVNLLLTQQDEFLHCNKVDSLRRAECGEEAYMAILYTKRALGGTWAIQTY